ncbi:cytochrome c [Dyadobacter jejuensis]|uniref:Cytochrome c n=1 Tax=Dyadobacter jejuensis TaxID=1082580 RepID=A0A316AXS0_9BACT|nr:DUF1553 domain-containing protein [Dyadobacter jejuensis]PWJ55007.1 cytochrome c [Dyadobacter jejuensis]
MKYNWRISAWPGIGVLFVVLNACQPSLPAEVEVAMETLPERALDYNMDVKPILSDKCFACHGPDEKKQKAGLRLDVAEGAYGELPKNPGKRAIDPGSLRNSEVIRRILSQDPDEVMPTPGSHLTLSDYEKAVLVKWVREGAEYKPHWAFVNPEMPQVPEPKRYGDLVKNPIDQFILSTLEEKELQPSKQADKETLIRRVTLDLTGLPPTLSEIDAFLNDKSENAYEKLVVRLLNSTHYGEQMATNWLDVARFADSHGYTVDRIRDMSPYRDWVIKAFNKNMSYDTFLEWQLAGDLMKGPNEGPPTKEMRIATAFNRNHPQNLEGGIVESEFQTEYVLDRANTVGDGILALSVGCARCHDHKYDPVSQKNYYQLSAFFNNIEEAGQISWDDAMPSPTMLLPTTEQERFMDSIAKVISNLEKSIRVLESQGQPDFEKWISSQAYRKLAAEAMPQAGLQAHFDFDDQELRNKKNQKETAFLTRETGKKEEVALTEGKFGKGALLNGDTWINMGKVGIFNKSEPFTIGVWVNIPKDLKDGVILHKSLAERLYNFRGYHLFIRDGLLEMNLGHVYPSNAITKLSKKPLPSDQWIQLTMTYDGSSRADGLKLYLNGAELDMETKMDQLTKDILFDADKVTQQPGLQIGGWWRGNGFKNGKVDQLLVYNRRLTPYEIRILAQKASWKELASKPATSLSDTEKASLKAYYFSNIYRPIIETQELLKQKRMALASRVEEVQELMVFQESKQPKQAYVRDRGVYDAIGEKVYPNTPERIFRFPENLPKNRLGLAKWMTHPDNPLTARVAVNRYWQMFFGTGIVKTSEDFGNQGELPSHPALLDWLALEFQRTGWDVKRLLKLMVLSATYQQDSRPTKQQLEKDFQNRYLARGPGVRLTAEMMRDNALAASGLLNPEIGGKSIKPYQPDGLWRINGATYVPDTGAVIYKRSLYVIVKRSVPNPTLATFDASARNACTVRRQKTNTPLQALVTLNDPTFVEAAKVLGEKMAQTDDAKGAIVDTYRKLTGRRPNQQELAILLKLRAAELEKMKAKPEKTKGWLNTGQYRVDTRLDPAIVASNAVVASTILNSDATITKR